MCTTSAQAREPRRSAEGLAWPAAVLSGHLLRRQRANDDVRDSLDLDGLEAVLPRESRGLHGLQIWALLPRRDRRDDRVPARHHLPAILGRALWVPPRQVQCAPFPSFEP